MNCGMCSLAWGAVVHGVCLTSNLLVHSLPFLITESQLCSLPHQVMLVLLESIRW
jgi:hypothetical protein